MQITKDLLCGKIIAYLNRRISIKIIVDWAETAMIESDYEEKYFEEIADTLAKIGLIDVKNFELPIAFYLNTLAKFKYKIVFGLEPEMEEKSELIYA